MQHTSTIVQPNPSALPLNVRFQLDNASCWHLTSNDLVQNDTECIDICCTCYLIIKNQFRGCPVESACLRDLIDVQDVL